MKTLKFILAFAVILAIHSVTALAQTINKEFPKQDKPNYIAVNENMAVNIIFPLTIKRAQWVSKDIAVQQFTGIDHILLVKANKPDFPLTNISVVTNDGQLYSFVIGYSREISLLNLEYNVPKKDVLTSSYSGTELNEADISRLAEKALRTESNFRKISQTKHGIKFILEAIFISGNTMFYRLSLRNSTNVQYDIDQLRFYVRDEKKSKRTSSQELEMLPLLRLGTASTVKGNDKQGFIYALKKFTIPDKKYLTVEIMEKGGGRHLELKAKNKKVLQAQSLLDNQI